MTKTLPISGRSLERMIPHSTNEVRVVALATASNSPPTNTRLKCLCGQTSLMHATCAAR